MSGGSDALDALAARCACQDIATRSYRLVDEGHASEVPALFTADGVFEVESRVRIEGTPALTEFFTAREADRARRTRHCLVDGLWRQTSATEAEQEATLLLFLLGSEDPEAGVPVRALATVRDRFRAEDGVWRIAQRLTRALAGGA